MPHPRSYTIRAASTPALHAWRAIHAARVEAGQTDRQMINHIEAEIAERETRS